MGYHSMSDEEVWAFLSGVPPHTGKLATIRPDGRPHVAPVWFAVDGRSLLFNTGAESVKGRNMRRDPRVALCVDDEQPPFTFVTIDGTVEIIGELAEVKLWAAVIGGRYMGADQAEAYGDRNAVPGELLVRLRPDRVVSAKDVAL